MRSLDGHASITELRGSITDVAWGHQVEPAETRRWQSIVRISSESGDLAVRVCLTHREATSFQVSEAIDDSPNRLKTKLDFQSDGTAHIRRSDMQNGLHVVDLADIPPEIANTINAGLSIVEYAD